MIATGNHYHFHSLRRAPPLTQGRLWCGAIRILFRHAEGAVKKQPLSFFLDFLLNCAIIPSDRKKQIHLRGAGCVRLRVGNAAQTREPDTASTVGGKDAHMGYLVSHFT